MNKDLLQIIEYYGLEQQLEYFQSEVWELNEAIINYEQEKFFKALFDLTIIDSDRKKHIAEEIADCLVMLEQFRLYLDLGDMVISDNIIYPESDILKYNKLFQKHVYRLSESILKMTNISNINYRMLEVYISLKQFQLYYEITNKELVDVMKYKIERQLKRIENEEL